MKVLVGVKQVPGQATARFVPGLNRIDREDVGNEMNPHDRSALDCAQALCREHGGEVVAFTMGPPQASSVLDEAVGLGADRALHLVDMRFGGADTLATSRALSQLCRREQPDLVLFGRVAVDGGTSQVAPQVAEMLGWPAVTEASEVRCEDGGALTVCRRTGGNDERWSVELPAVVSLDRIESGEPTTGALRVPGHGAVTTVDADALGGAGAGYGIRGSATYVQRIDPVEPRTPKQVVTDPDAAAEALRATARPAPTAVRPPLAPAGPASPRDAPARRGQLWVVAEQGGQPLRAAEGIAAAVQVAGRLDAEVVAVVLGGAEEGDAERLASAGAERVLVAVSPALDAAAGSTDAEVDALSDLIAERSPLAVVGPWTRRGRHYMARVAARLEVGLTGDVVGLDTSPRPGSDEVVDLVWLKPAWNGAALARVVARSAVAMGTLRPASTPALTCAPAAAVPIETVDVTSPTKGRRQPLLVERLDTSEVPADEAEVVVCVGVAAAASLPAIFETAALLGWAVGGTRAAVAAGLVPPGTGLVPERFSLSPRVAVGVGVESAEDLAPMRGAATIATVDLDKDAPAHTIADLVLACDPGELFDALGR